MNLKIRYNRRTHNLKISGHVFYLRLIMLIIDVFTISKKSRYFFLAGLNCLLKLLSTSLQIQVFKPPYLPEIIPVTVILASTICKQGPPALTEHYQYLSISCITCKEISICKFRRRH